MLAANDINRVLIIGIGGGLARILTNLLLKTYPNIEITGVDNRQAPESILSPRVNVHRMRYSRNNFETLFRSHKFDCVFHLARLSHLSANKTTIKEKNNINIMGTKTILELSLKYQVRKVVVISTYHVYGAYADNPLYLTEDAPLRATFEYPELHDVVEMDQGTTTFMWRHKDELSVILLRPCNIIGPTVKNAISRYLAMPLAPVPLDYNPMFQFVHESDMARVMMRSLERLPTGVYNVAPSDTISMVRAKKLLGVDYSRLPISLVKPLARFVNMPIPRYLFEYLKFSCIVGTDEISRHLGLDFCRYSTEDAVLDLDVR